jgi:peptide methionine sulfoxide reductase MsrA
VVTQVVAAPEWWRAEEYHQKYFEKHGRLGCAI